MKQTSKIILISISLLGLALFIWKLYPLRFNRELPPLPPNLGIPANHETIDLAQQVPILMYHHIQKYPGKISISDPSIFVSPENFEKQLIWLKKNGFHTVDFADINNPQINKPIILTFDDGYQDAYETAFPLLQKYGFRGIFFPIVDNIDRPGFISSSEILSMKNAGMILGSHSLSHPNLGLIPEKQAEEEIYASKKILEGISQTTISDFCYPSGKFNDHVEDIVINSGYKTAVTTNSGQNIAETNPFELKRLNIQNDSNFDEVPEFKIR